MSKVLIAKYRCPYQMILPFNCSVENQYSNTTQDLAIITVFDALTTDVFLQG
jgi:hypothetical protein